MKCHVLNKRWIKAKRWVLTASFKHILFKRHWAFFNISLNLENSIPTYINLRIFLSQSFKLVKRFALSFMINQTIDIMFSSFELKAKWAILISCCPSSNRLSFHLFINFSHLHLLLKNHWANFNQSWYKAPFGKRD